MLMNSSSKVIALGAWFSFIGVLLGAFGAHIVRDRISASSLAIYHTGTLYHLVHALAILIVGVLIVNSSMKNLMISAKLFVVGIVLFSGSLYLLAVTGIKVLGAITPLGGLCFLSGWVILALRATKSTASAK